MMIKTPSSQQKKITSEPLKQKSLLSFFESKRLGEEKQLLEKDVKLIIGPYPTPNTVTIILTPPTKVSVNNNEPLQHQKPDLNDHQNQSNESILEAESSPIKMSQSFEEVIDSNPLPHDNLSIMETKSNIPINNENIEIQLNSILLTTNPIESELISNDTDVNQIDETNVVPSGKSKQKRQRKSNIDKSNFSSKIPYEVTVNSKESSDSKVKYNSKLKNQSNPIENNNHETSMDEKLTNNPLSDSEGKDIGDSSNKSRPKRVRKAPLLYEPTENIGIHSVYESTSDDDVDENKINEVDDILDPESQIPKKKSKSKSKKSTASEQKGEIAKIPQVDPLSLLTSEALTKVNSCNENLIEVAKDLSETERYPDLRDEELDLNLIIDDVKKFLFSKENFDKSSSLSAAVEQSSNINNSMNIDVETVDVQESASNKMKSNDSVVITPMPESSQIIDIVNSAISRIIQGSHLPLSLLISHTRFKLSELLNQIMSQICDNSEMNHRVLLVQDEFTKYLDDNNLNEKIRCLAERESYRTKARNVQQYEDIDETALWRWDVKILSNFSKASQPILREAKINRGRYRRLAKAISKVMEQVIKLVDESKLHPLEEIVSGARIEVAKAKERRREYERKKAEEAEQKRLREEAREMKRREKDEQAILKATEDKEKAERTKIHVPTEKEIKEREALEKQKNLLNSFFKKVEISQIDSNIQKSAPVISLDESGTVIDEDIVVSTSQNDPPVLAVIPSVNMTKAVARYPWQQGPKLDYESFEKIVFSNMSFPEIHSMNRRRSTVASSRGSRRKFIKIAVTISSNQSAFGGDTYSETRVVEVDDKIKTLSFHAFEWEVRPAYVGTFSKSSNNISGRRPFAKDIELINYDYDSGAEWEEEEEGEDIDISDGEDEDGEDELEYDDVFVRDNDFGSDVGSDGEVMAKVAMRVREGEERLGPKFIKADISVIEDIDGCVSSYGVVARSVIKFKNDEWIYVDKDVESNRLSSYTTIIYPNHAAFIPILGNLSSKSNKVDTSVSNPAKPTFDESMIRKLQELIHSKKDGVDKLVTEYQILYPSISKAQIKRMILELAEKKRHVEGYGTPRWICKDIKQLTSLVEVQFTPRKDMKNKKVSADKPLTISKKQGKDIPLQFQLPLTTQVDSMDIIQPETAEKIRFTNTDENVLEPTPVEMKLKESIDMNSIVYKDEAKDADNINSFDVKDVLITDKSIMI